MVIEVFTFPTMKDGVLAVEQRFCELYKAYRDGEQLEPEALDWMDSANTWLCEARSNV